jgi:hypothetical protein
MRLLLGLALLVASACTVQPLPIRTTYSFQQRMDRGWAEGAVIRGKRDGRWVFFDRRGRLTVEGTYRAGVMHGLWRYHFEDGQTVSLDYFDGVIQTPDELGRSTTVSRR